MNRAKIILVGVVFHLLLGGGFVFSFTMPPELSVTKPTGGSTWVVGPGGDFTTVTAADSSPSVQPGDTIKIKAGVYTIGSLSKSGSSGNEIVLILFSGLSPG